MSDMHSHKCPKCGTIWKHDRDAIPAPKLDAAHNCPAEGCDGHESWRYAGEGEALFCDNGERTIDLRQPALAEA